MEQQRITVEGSDLENALDLACEQLGLKNRRALEFEYDKDHFRNGAATVKIQAWGKDPHQIEAIQTAVDFVKGFLERFGIHDASIFVDEGETKIGRAHV